MKSRGLGDVYKRQRQIRTHNPLTLTFHEWRDMFADVRRERDLRYLWKAPDWRSPASRSVAADLTAMRANPSHTGDH